MNRDLKRFPKRHYDLLVIGGGINGAAIANLAAAAGARVALVEKADWASGTSSKSTKLLHGGIRYLENFEFDLVAESLKERFIQWKNVPYLVKPVRFVVPVYKGAGRPLWMMKLGVWLYDLLSGRYSLGGHATLSVEEVLQLAPGIEQDGLAGGVSYFDAQMDDARICLENVLMARKRGADIANYVEVVEFLKVNGRATGVRVRDTLSGDVAQIMAEKIIVAAGPWSDRMKHKDSPQSRPCLRPTKGVHIVHKGTIGENAFLLQNKDDKRIFFIIPFKGNMLIGTTDTDYKDMPDQVRVEEEDIDYLLSRSKAAFPALDFSREGIISTFAGLRPLVHERGSPSKVSRKHVLERNFSGVYYVMGGKYTTYRAIARECVAKLLPDRVRRLPGGEHYALFGSGLVHEDVRTTAVRYGVPAETVQYLMSLYGSRFSDVLALTEADHSLKGKLCTCSPAIRAQVLYSLNTEMAMGVDDIYDRRLGLSYNNCPDRKCRQAIVEMLKQ